MSAHVAVRPANAQATNPVESSYGRILESSALIGLSTLGSMLVGLVRTKAIAVMLGPSGLGLMGVLTSIFDLARSAADLGVTQSGVRQIAVAHAGDDANRVAVTVTVLRRVVVVLALVSAAVLAAVSPWVSSFTFGSGDHALAIALVALALLVRVVSDGQGAVLQALRRVADLARVNLYAAVAGTAIGIVFIHLYGELGVAWTLVALAGASLACSWRYGRRLGVRSVTVDAATVSRERAALFGLGFAFMVSGVMMVATMYLVRIIVVRTEGLGAAGLYQAAWALGGLYVGVILQAMNTDFYPRLAASIDDHPAANRLVDEQTHAGLLLAGPGVIATLVLAEVVLPLLYSAAFSEAAGVLRAICIGFALRVVSWPVGYVVVAKNRKALFLAVDGFWVAVNLGLTWFMVREWGLMGVGIAFACSYAVHTLVVYVAAARLTGYRASGSSVRIACVLAVSSVVVIAGFESLAQAPALVLGVLILAVSAGYSLHGLARLVPHESLPLRVRPVVAALSRRLPFSRRRR